VALRSGKVRDRDFSATTKFVAKSECGFTVKLAILANRCCKIGFYKV
jgi:hypothetical protein